MSYITSNDFIYIHVNYLRIALLQCIYDRYKLYDTYKLSQNRRKMFPDYSSENKFEQKHAPFKVI